MHNKTTTIVLLAFCSLFSLSTFAVSTSTLIAAGGIAPFPDPTSPPITPLLLTSQDQGKSWQTMSVKNVPETNFSFSKVACADSGICSAVGIFATTAGKPVLAVSYDSGKSWEAKDFPNLSQDTVLNDVSCSDVKQGTYCVAVGNSKSQPIILSSKDGAKTWNPDTHVNFSDGAILNSVTCKSDKTQALCIASGQDSKGVFLAVKAAASEAWQVKPLNVSFGYINNVSCTDPSPNAACIAFGSNAGDQLTKPVVANSLDGGNNWKLNDLPNLSPNMYYGTWGICNGGKDNSTCILYGYKGIFSPEAVLAVSHDNGITWKNKTIPNVPNDNGIGSMACTTLSNSKTQCLTFTGDASYNLVVAETNDSGDTWQIKGSPLPAKDYYRIANVGNGPNNTYVLTGLSTISVSQDGGNSWVNSPTPSPYTNLLSVSATNN